MVFILTRFNKNVFLLSLYIYTHFCSSSNKKYFLVQNHDQNINFIKKNVFRLKEIYINTNQPVGNTKNINAQCLTKGINF